MRKQLAVTIGIDDYPGSGNDLNGCVADSNYVREFLQNNDYNVIQLTNQDATVQNVTDELQRAMANLRWGDRFIFHNSTHGSYVPDANGDELDARDEVLVLYGFHDWTNAYLTDDRMREIFDNRKPGTRVMQISDSCYSGTVSRFMDTTKMPGRARFFNPALLRPEAFPNPPDEYDRLPPRSRRIIQVNTLLWAACRDDEVAYEDWVSGEARGAFTVSVLSQWQKDSTVRAWRNRVVLDMKDANQHPQMDATESQFRWRMP